MSKLITVFGVTGNQGGSVVTQLLNDASLSKEFKIRGVTRDTSKPAAQELAKKGVEVVTADLNDKASLEVVLKGSHTVFLMTNFWENASPDVEKTHGKYVTDVAKEVGVQHLIFSSLLSAKDATKGRLTHVPHFDSKAEIEQYIRESGVPATFFLPGYFMSNLEMMVRPGPDGVLTWALPIGKDSKFPMIDIKSDTGKFVKAIIKNRESLLGARVFAAEAYYTPTELLDQIAEVTGKKTQFMQVDEATYKSFLPEFMAKEMLENHLFIEEPGYFGSQGAALNHENLEEKLTTYKEYLKNTNAFNA